MGDTGGGRVIRREGEAGEYGAVVGMRVSHTRMMNGDGGRRFLLDVREGQVRLQLGKDAAVWESRMQPKTRITPNDSQPPTRSKSALPRLDLIPVAFRDVVEQSFPARPHVSLREEAEISTVIIHEEVIWRAGRSAIHILTNQRFVIQVASSGKTMGKLGNHQTDS